MLFLGRRVGELCANFFAATEHHTHAAMGRDYYQILGVPRDADDEALKKRCVSQASSNFSVAPAAAAAAALTHASCHGQPREDERVRSLRAFSVC